MNSHDRAAETDCDCASKTLVSILNWNGTLDTLACLSDLDLPFASEFHFVVLDNGSSQDPTDQFLKLVPPIEYIRLPTNTGFTGGHNHVMKIALARGYGSVLLLNNDCKISIESLRRMREQLNSDPLIGAVSPLIYRDGASKIPMMVAGWINWANHRSVRPNSPDAVQPAGTPTLLLGTALLLRSDMLTKTGLLDDRYFAYYEDNDLSVRIHDHGFKSVYCVTATCLHDYRSLHQYSPMALYLLTRNAWLFWQQHTPAPFRKGLRRSLIAGALHDLALLQKNQVHDEKLDAVVDGLWDGLHAVSGPPVRAVKSPRWFRWATQARPYFMFRMLSRWAVAPASISSSK